MPCRIKPDFGQVSKDCSKSSNSEHWGIFHKDPLWSLGRAAALRASVEQALMAEVPGLRATISLLPTDVEAQSVQHPQS